MINFKLKIDGCESYTYEKTDRYHYFYFNGLKKGLNKLTKEHITTLVCDECNNDVK